MYSLEGCTDAGFEDAGNGFPPFLYNVFIFEKRDEWMLRVACYKEAIVALEFFA
jgi:hypothetical protein